MKLDTWYDRRKNKKKKFQDFNAIMRPNFEYSHACMHAVVILIQHDKQRTREIPKIFTPFQIHDFLEQCILDFETRIRKCEKQIAAKKLEEKKKHLNICTLEIS